jgi:hypothetical protein
VLEVPGVSPERDTLLWDQAPPPPPEPAYEPETPPPPPPPPIAVTVTLTDVSRSLGRTQVVPDVRRTVLVATTKPLGRN